MKAYTHAWDSGTILIQPDPTTAFAQLPYIELVLPPDDAPLPKIIPKAEDLVKPELIGEKYYLVVCGEELGIFGCWYVTVNADGIFL